MARLTPSRRHVLAMAAAGTLGAATARVSPVWATGAPQRHGFSPLGALKYAPGEAFAYVDTDAPRGGALHLTRVGAFDTIDTLTYPGRPPADLRLIYDHLIVESDDEVASYYGLLAEEIEVAPDYSAVIFTIRPEARWHDGEPVTAADVAFTFERLKSEGAPYYRQAFRPLSVTAEGDRAIFANARPGDRDVVRRISTIPIHPAHVWSAGRPEAPVGSGPYRLETFEAPQRLVLAREPDYWGRDLAVNRGRWNFDTLAFTFYRDPTVALEAFKAGEADVRSEDDPTRWARGYEGPALASASVVREETEVEGVGELAGLVANMRRPLLADRRVRLALALAYDFEAVNALLFHGSLQPLQSVFAGTPLAASGPAGAERDLVAELPEAALDDPDPLAGLPQPGTRAGLAEAARLLDEAGLTMQGGARVDPATGQPVRLRVLSMSPALTKPLPWLTNSLGNLGITLDEVRADPATAAQMTLDKDFDLATLTWSPARLPGTAERLLWHSALADAPHSYALSGVDSPILDACIEALERAASPAELERAGRAFDRVFRHIMPMVPLWRSATVRTAWWDRFGRPQAERTGFPPSPIDRWWAAG
ncbi:extracellular solute-binding protein [Acuticoccus sp. I52.16.1]|uniref:extracellular solute-binding protein n=1 Tax=Acuticoccus sp. I52.16.1 TaxID=2928472 RepID=UPI001FD6294D|nr:extracellular solute-binding protein [Acuticoccus sp. I52.16.1]UOM33913.1 extracellular solute-binding protein [Acuticoccus sp. I52.16.1]